MLTLECDIPYTYPKKLSYALSRMLVQPLFLPPACSLILEGIRLPNKRSKIENGRYTQLKIIQFESKRKARNTLYPSKSPFCILAWGGFQRKCTSVEEIDSAFKCCGSPVGTASPTYTVTGGLDGPSPSELKGSTTTS